jgi:hypothetical protein
MSFCKLSDGQKAVLIFFKSLQAQPDSKAAQRLNEWISEHKWEKIHTVLELGSDNPPSIDDISTVGLMSAGLRDAHFFLALVDMDPSVTGDFKSGLEDALDTCCWDNVAEMILENDDEDRLDFSGSDLHQAYAPDDDRACVALPDGLRDVIQGIIMAGEAVGKFFSQTLPDFFANDFVNFFTETIPDFFTGPFLDFFKDLGGWIAEGFDIAWDSFIGLFD